MALFFFHFFDGVERSDDDAGLELASSETAYLEAVAAARGMWSELLEGRCDPSRCAFEIVDEHQELLFRFEFSELLDRCAIAGFTAEGSTAKIAQDLKDTHLRATIAKQELSASLVEVRKTLRDSYHLLGRLTAAGGGGPLV